MNGDDKRISLKNIFRPLSALDEIREPIDSIILESTSTMMSPSATKGIPDRFKQLDKFFNGMLTYGDVIRFADCELTEQSYESRYAGLGDTIDVPPHCDVVMLWQWAEDSPVFSLYMPCPVIKNRIKDIIPSKYLAKRMAIMAIADDFVSINLVYMLTGVISQHDPVHEEIRKHGR